MSITIRCTECGVTSQDGLLSHLDTCSANKFLPIIGHGMMPPATELVFGSEAERKKFMRNLNKPGGTKL